MITSNAQCKYEKRNWNPFSKVMRKRNTKNEIQIRFSKWWENEKQKPKFKCPFQSAAKTKNVKQNSNPCFNVTSRRKTKNRNGNGIPFYKAEEKRKIKWNLNSFVYAIEKRLALRYTHSWPLRKHDGQTEVSVWAVIGGFRSSAFVSFFAFNAVCPF